MLAIPIRKAVNSLEPLCVPRMYLGSAFLRFFYFLPFRRINNLPAFKASKSSIPTRASKFFSVNVLAAKPF